MGHKFLSDAWFEAADKIFDEISPPVPEIVKNLVINFRIKGGPDGDVDMRMDGGRMLKGGSTTAPTTVSVPYEVASKMMVDQDPNAAMQAFMSGQIQVEGDMSRIMMLQAAGPPSAESLEVQKRVREMTD
jgi:SCP-2 sterol transfer family